MSSTLVCLSEPVAFHSHHAKKAERSCSDSCKIDCESHKRKEANSTSIESENNYSNTGSPLKEIYSQKQTVSRKREATNILLECVKRRDNTRHYDVASGVPFSMSNHETPLDMSDFCSLSSSACEEEDNAELENASCNADLSDSGIDISSKSSSPSHSINALSSQDDSVEECSGNMEIEPTQPQEPSDGQSTVPIYEDLSSLRLTDDVMPTDNSPPKSPISESLFKYVAPCIYFASKGENVTPMPENILPYMKWKLSTITPIIIKEIVQKSGFVLLDANTTEEWLGTWGKHLKCASFKRIRPFQKVNHYPGSFHLGRKDKLWENYKSMQSRYGEDVFNFFPETFHLPNDINLLKSAWEGENKCWIIKPPASARGTGVKVIHKWSQVPKSKPVIVQRYLSDPYLINGTKFDLRIYVLVPSIEPLRIYVFEDGLVRFASEKYSLSNKSFSNRFVHLTNYSINRKSSSYTANEDGNLCQGHKWTLKTFWTYMSNSGIDIEKIQDSITDMIIKTIMCAEGPISRLLKIYAKSSYNCFELFGFDIMLDKNLRPWLLEVNISPSLHIRSMLDASVKGEMVKDMLNMAAFELPEKRFACVGANPSDCGVLSTVAWKHKILRNRSLTHAEKAKHSLHTFHVEKYDILKALTPDDVRCLIETEDEYHRRGAFTRVFPTKTSHKYFAFFEHIRYYNVLLDAWERRYSSRRNEGISMLQELCDKKFHLQGFVREPSQPVKEPEIEITATAQQSTETLQDVQKL